MTVTSDRAGPARSATAGRGEKRVGVVLNLLTHVTRSMATGVAQYASEKGNWNVTLVHGAEGFPIVLGDVDFSALDGLVAGYTWERRPPVTCPVVYVHTPEVPPTAPTVCADNHAIGRLAADHLVSLGLPYFSFVGLANNAFSRERQQGFETALASQRRSIQPPLLFPFWHEMTHGRARMRAWLGQILLPCAIFCADDRVAAGLAEAARAAGLHVPDQVAILGVNDDDLACNATVPGLSSIRANGELIGYEAARRLERLMLGLPQKRLLTRIPPGGIVQRGSTQVLGYGDLMVCEAMRLIRTRAPHEQVKVDQIARELRVHRQQLSRSFLACVGHSPKQEIDRVRRDRLRALLCGSTLSIKQIAYEMGFAGPSQLVRFCCRTLGQSPTQLRETLSSR